MSAVLEQLHVDLNGDLERIARRFKPGAKLTLVVRQPHIEGDAGLVATDDDLDAVIAELVIRKANEGGRVFGPGAAPATRPRRARRRR